MNVTLQIPDPIAEVLGYATDTLPRRALEALLVDECVRGRISRGKVAEVLGLSFQEAETFFRQHHVPYPIKGASDDALAKAAPEKSERPTRETALAALRQLRALGTFKAITDPVAWQREIRKDRPLPGCG
jgi:hypothetical protein